MMERRLFVAASFGSLTFARFAFAAADAADVISLGGDVTEIVYALGQGRRLIARDSTSTYPDAVNDLPDVGYLRQLSAEGVLSFAPSLIVSAEGAGPPEVVDILRAASVDFIEVPSGYDAEAIAQKIRVVGAALQVTDLAENLVEQTQTEIDLAVANASRAEGVRKRVLFVLSTQGGRILASGTGTGADGIIQMSGALNAISEFEGYKPLTDEAAAAAAPDVILMMDREGNHASTDEELFTMPALSATPAAETKSVVRMNSLLLLGFGPRTAKAVTALNQALYPV